MMLSLSAIHMLLVSVIAFSYANLSIRITFTCWVVNNEIIIVQPSQTLLTFTDLT